MAEIKSTLDLVMEKTKNIVQTEEEQQEIRERDWENKARSLLLKLNDGRLKPEDLPQALGDFGDNEGAFIRDKLLRIVIDQLTIEGKNLNRLAIIEAAAGDHGKDGLKKLQDIFLEHEKSIVELSSIYEKKVLDILKEAGISGSALQPKVGHDPDWIHARSGMSNQFESRLNRIKAELAERLGLS
ncbi:MAG: hypothetical protein JRD68_06605 [Deltaproteobacteria bacterium]|nr:hypothetical protein [Deltaproteobacteria bacterium]